MNERMNKRMIELKYEWMDEWMKMSVLVKSSPYVRHGVVVSDLVTIKH